MKGLTAEQDAFGHGISDHLNGNAGAEVVERDDGLVEPDGGPAAYFRPFREWPACEKKALRSVHGKVLDVGAGAGRIALHLQELGHEVVAIDNSPLAIRVCKRRGVKNAHVVPFADVSRKLGVFDTVAMFGNNFGLFGSADRARTMLKRLHGMTGQDARIVAMSVDPYVTAEPVHLAYHKLNRKRGRMPGQLRIRVRYKTYATPWFDYLIVSPKEMAKILSGTGWHIAKLHDGRTPRMRPYMVVIEKV